MNKRLFIVFILGFSSGLPLALVSSTLQAWFADTGMSVMATGMLTLLGLPYVYRLFWSPLLDRYPLTRLGKRRSWILGTQVLLLVGINMLGWCQPSNSPQLMAVIALGLAFLSATQDIGIDAHRTEYLRLEEHGIGASMAVFGYRLAMLCSGGLALIVADHYGWEITYRFMGLLMIPGMIATLMSPEPSLHTNTVKSIKETFCEPVNALFARKDIVALLLFIFFYKLGEAFTTSTSGVVMPFLLQRIGFSLDVVGTVYNVVGVLALLLGGLISGILLMRISIYRALFWFGMIQALTNALFVVLAMVGKNVPVFVVAVVSDNIAAGMGSTAIVALFMRLVDRRFTATQFSLLVAVSALPRILSGPFAAVTQGWFGWEGVFQLSVILALGFIPFLAILRRSSLTTTSDKMRAGETCI